MTMMKFHQYTRVESIEALDKAFRETEGPITLLAGGSDILVRARQDDRYKDHTIVDIFGIESLRQIDETDGELVIGACATHADIADSPLVKTFAPILAEASLSVGSPQIRNHATIGGNLANASPAADTLAALAVLKAKLLIRKDGEERVVPLIDIFERPYRTNLTDRELIVAVLVPKQASDVKYNYTKVGRRKALSISRMTIATLLQMDAQGVVTRFDMTMGATFPRPMTFPDIAPLLVGKRPSKEDIEAVAVALSNKIPEIASIRASTKYKQPVCKRLCERILNELLGGHENA